MNRQEDIKIAIIDDDEDDYFIIMDYISEIEGRSFAIEWHNEYSTAIEKIRARAYDIYFVDYRLGNQTGLDLLQEAMQMGCDDPIVLLTGKGNKAIDIKAMQSGATDYLVKSELNTEKLERCIRYSLDRSSFLKELKARENKYRNLFESSKDAVFIADENLSFIEVNEAATELCGTTAKTILSKTLLDYIRDDRHKTDIRNALIEGRVINDKEIKLQPENDPETKICQLSISLLENSGSGTRVHGIIHDITNIKKAEQANLQAEKLAANERLVRMLAHEIRNPLNNISLSIENLQMSSGDEELTKNLLAILQRNSSRINSIITELLNLTKPLELVFEKYTLQEIMDESLAIASDRIDLQKISVAKKYPDQPIEIEADKSKLIIAFNNILINAVEAMEVNKGKLMVEISTSPEGYQVSIQDNGYGISEEYMSKLFEPFFTLKKNGMGLGLAATYSIIQSHKGVIRVDTAVGKGTNFIVSFKKNAQMRTNGIVV